MKYQMVIKTVIFAVLASLFIFLAPLLVEPSIYILFPPPGHSVTRLIETPWLFHSRTVRIIGFISLKFESTTLYPLKDYYKYGIGEKVWIDIDSNVLNKYLELDQHYVYVEGKFDAIRQGRGTSAGTIHHITHLEKAREFL